MVWDVKKTGENRPIGHADKNKPFVEAVVERIVP